MLINFRQERLMKERRQKIFGALFLLALVLIFSRSWVMSGLGRVVHVVGIPFWSARNSALESTAYMEEYMRPRNALVKDILTLREKTAELESTSIETNQLRAENDELKAQLGRKEHFKTVLARVLSRPPFQAYDTLIIDLGAKDRVVIGANVFAHGSYVIGTITRVYDTTSVVTLASAPGETKVASVARNNATGADREGVEKYELLFTGTGGGGFRTQVPKHMNISEGTPMVLSLGKQAYLGIISAEHIPEGGSLKTVYGTLPFSVNGLQWVSVEEKDGEPTN